MELCPELCMFNPEISRETEAKRSQRTGPENFSPGTEKHIQIRSTVQERRRAISVHDWDLKGHRLFSIANRADFFFFVIYGIAGRGGAGLLLSALSTRICRENPAQEVS